MVLIETAYIPCIRRQLRGLTNCSIRVPALQSLGQFLGRFLQQWVDKIIDMHCHHSDLVLSQATFQAALQFLVPESLFTSMFNYANEEDPPAFRERLARSYIQSRWNGRIQPGWDRWVTRVLEYISYEILDSAIMITELTQYHRMDVRELIYAIQYDPDLYTLACTLNWSVSDIHIPTDGVYPPLHTLEAKRTYQQGFIARDEMTRLISQWMETHYPEMTIDSCVMESIRHGIEREMWQMARITRRCMRERTHATIDDFQLVYGLRDTFEKIFSTE
jgi:hypothetical protein